MARLIDEISKFLSTNGFGHSIQLRHDLEVICTNGRSSGCPKVILPLPVRARSVEEAMTASLKADECIRFISHFEGYPVIIPEDRWRSRTKMMQDRLLAHLEVFDQIYARNCEVRKIDKKTAGEFLAANHSYGDAACRYRYGLFLKRHTGHVAAGGQEAAKYPADTLVAVATFSNARKWIKGDKTIRSYEWTRYVSLPGVRLSGGMGKLLKAFIEEVRPNDIMSYADLEWSEGKAYRKLGFSREEGKGPVSFSIDSDWERKAIRQTGNGRNDSADLYHVNFGSSKYRLKLTDYQ